MMQGWYYIEHLTRQRHDRVQTESRQLQPWTTASPCTYRVSHHGVASNEVIGWSTDQPLNAENDDLRWNSNSDFSRLVNVTSKTRKKGQQIKPNLLHFITCYTALPTRSKQLSTVATHGFQFGLYHVGVSLRVSRSTYVVISPASLLRYDTIRYEYPVNDMRKTFVTIEQQWCYVTLTTVENMFIKFCTGMIQIQEMLMKVLLFVTDLYILVMLLSLNANSENKRIKR